MLWTNLGFIKRYSIQYIVEIYIQERPLRDVLRTPMLVHDHLYTRIDHMYTIYKQSKLHDIFVFQPNFATAALCSLEAANLHALPSFCAELLPPPSCGHWLRAAHPSLDRKYLSFKIRP